MCRRKWRQIQIAEQIFHGPSEPFNISGSLSCQRRGIKMPLRSAQISDIHLIMSNDALKSTQCDDQSANHRERIFSCTFYLCMIMLSCLLCCLLLALNARKHYWKLKQTGIINEYVLTAQQTTVKPYPLLLALLPGSRRANVWWSQCQVDSKRQTLKQMHWLVQRKKARHHKANK